MRGTLLTVLLAVVCAVARPLAPPAPSSATCNATCKRELYTQVGFAAAQAGVALVYTAFDATVWCDSAPLCRQQTADLSVGTAEMVVNHLPAQAMSDDCRTCVWEAANDVARRAAAYAILTTKWLLFANNFTAGSDVKNVTEASIALDATFFRLLQENATVIANVSRPHDGPRERDARTISIRADVEQAGIDGFYSSLGQVFREGVAAAAPSIHDVLETLAQIFQNMVAGLWHKSYNRPNEIKEKREKLAREMKSKAAKAGGWVNNLEYSQYRGHNFIAGDFRYTNPEHPLYERRTRGLVRDAMRGLWDRLKLWMLPKSVRESRAAAAEQQAADHSAAFEEGLDQLARTEAMSMFTWMEGLEMPRYILPDDISVLDLGEPLIPVEHSGRPNGKGPKASPKTAPDSVIDSEEFYEETEDGSTHDEHAKPGSKGGAKTALDSVTDSDEVYEETEDGSARDPFARPDVVPAPDFAQWQENIDRQNAKSGYGSRGGGRGGGRGGWSGGSHRGGGDWGYEEGGRGGGVSEAAVEAVGGRG